MIKYKKDGFTLVEVLLVMGLAILIFATGSVFSLSEHSRGFCRGERDVILTLLYSARGRAMNNINKSSHGIHFEENHYILFSGNSYTKENPMNEKIPKFSATPVLSPENIIFDALTGKVGGAISEIIVGNSEVGCMEKITLNHEGGIDW